MLVARYLGLGVAHAASRGGEVGLSGAELPAVKQDKYGYKATNFELLNSTAPAAGVKLTITRYKIGDSETANGQPCGSITLCILPVEVSLPNTRELSEPLHPNDQKNQHQVPFQSMAAIVEGINRLLEECQRRGLNSDHPNFKPLVVAISLLTDSNGVIAGDRIFYYEYNADNSGDKGKGLTVSCEPSNCCVALDRKMYPRVLVLE
jgi:hypothetical protein